MRLGICAGFGLFCIFASVILMIFVEIAQISARQKVPRSLQLVYLDATNFGMALAAAGASTSSLYTSGSRSGNNQGLRQIYSWGLWSYCGATGLATTNDDYCSETHWGNGFQPESALLLDTPTTLTTNVQSAIPAVTFNSNKYLNRTTKAAFYLYLIGAISAGVSLILGFCAHRFAYLFSALMAIVAFITLATASTIWTVIISRVKTGINNQTVSGTPLGLYIHYGNGLWLAWAAAGAAFISVFPFFFACCCGGRASDRDDYDDEKY